MDDATNGHSLVYSRRKLTEVYLWCGKWRIQLPSLCAIVICVGAVACNTSLAIRMHRVLANATS
jgi:hypothetical protein